MKIGIMSMQRIINYGSYMQAYALKSILEEFGAEVCFIDYTVDMDISLKKYYDNVPLKHLRLLKRHISHFKDRNSLKKAPEIFSLCYSKLGFDETRQYRTKVDTLVIGSDEVFNCLQSNPDVGYSLELFGKNRKSKKLISYAASFGDTTIDRLKDNNVDLEIGKYLKKFDAISVRDRNSTSIVETLTKKKPLEHLDPTLVGNIEKQKWEFCEEKNFMIVYGYENRFSEDEGKAIMEFAHKRNLKVITISGRQKFGDKYVFCRPDEVLGYFEKAECIVTDTFHGTIFSVLYHKPVAIFCRESKNFSYSNENKLLDLLYKLGLNEQRVHSLNDLEMILNQKIDYNRIDFYRAEERVKSIDYLKQYCKD